LENLQELVNAAAAFTAEENFDGLPAGRIPDPSGSLGSGANTAAGDIPFTASARSSEIAPASASAAQPGAEVGPMSPLAAFLTHASLEAGDNQAQAGQDAIQLMTVHSAKGLEFDSVFITGVEDGLFPHENSLLEAAGIEEERRLMYVAITRARERLYL